MDLKRIDKNLRVLPVSDTVIMCGMSTKVLVDDKIGSVLSTLIREGAPFVIGLTVKNTEKIDEVDESCFYKVGTLIHMDSIQEADKGFLVHFRALKRIHVDSMSFSDEGITATYSFLKEQNDMDESGRAAMILYLIKTIRDISEHFQGSDRFVKKIESLETPLDIINFSLPFMSVSKAEKQELLEIDSEKYRCLRFIDLLTRQKDSIELQIEMAQKLSSAVNKNQREAMLREQMRVIQEELNESSPQSKPQKDYRNLIEGSGMPDDVKDVALTELSRLESLGPQNHEAGILRSYLDLLTALPWKPGLETDIDLTKARAVLDDEHYGLDEVKDRIIQHLAVMKLKKEKKGSILLLVGPPGTGKTSLGRSIAHALERRYIRLSLGGIKDEAEIRGHRRTYIGALPGRIIQGMKKAGQKNPVFVLDEVDKLMTAFNGDPASALLEVLDPEQNNTFSDHYLEVPYDLSEVFFIATANSAMTIPPPLLDRMEVIQISSYTNHEKFMIAKNHLIPLIHDEHGLKKSQFRIEDEALHLIIEKYTREAGVRGLKKQLSKIARSATEKIVTAKRKRSFVVKSDMLDDILGKPVTRLEDALESNVPGVVTGLAWTPVGGDILFIEATSMPGKGELILTGQLGNVMKESARISLSLIRSRLAHLISNFDFAKNDIHIHIPSGAIPKDGPSAGITLFSALASLLLRRVVDGKTAMTGEITLRGSILPVGGIKEKLLAAHRAGIQTIILSKENLADLKKVPEEVKKELRFVPVETIEELIRELLHIELPVPGLMISETDDPVLATTAS